MEGGWFEAGRKEGRKVVEGGRKVVCGRKEGRWFMARGRKLICGTRKEVGLW